MVDELGLEDEPDADTPYQIGSAATDRVSIPIDLNDFPKVVGLLMFAVTRTRPDIAFITSSLATKVSSLRTDDMHAALYVVRYLKRTPNLGITFSYNGPIELHAFVDASYNCRPDAKGHSGMIFTLGEHDAAVVAKSQKQGMVSRSS